MLRDGLVGVFVNPFLNDRSLPPPPNPFKRSITASPPPKSSSKALFPVGDQRSKTAQGGRLWHFQSTEKIGWEKKTWSQCGEQKKRQVRLNGYDLGCGKLPSNSGK